MVSVYLRFLVLEEEKQTMERLQRRLIRDESDPLSLPEIKFQEYYRLNKEGFQYLLNLLKENLPPSGKIFAIPPVVKLAGTLRFLAEGSYQKGVGRQIDVGLAQSTFSEVLSEVLRTSYLTRSKIWPHPLFFPFGTLSHMKVSQPSLPPCN